MGRHMGSIQPSIKRPTHPLNGPATQCACKWGQLQRQPPPPLTRAHPSLTRWSLALNQAARTEGAHTSSILVELQGGVMLCSTHSLFCASVYRAKRRSVRYAASRRLGAVLKH